MIPLQRAGTHILSALCATVVVFTPYLLIIYDAPHIWYRYSWLDIPFHIAGGMVVGLWLYAGIVWRNAQSSLHHVGTIFALGAVSVAVGWEIFEYILDITTRTHWLGTWSDTYGDICNAAIGSAAVWIAVRNRI